MQIDESVTPDVISRLRRIEGQIGGLVRMIEDGRDCADVITQLSAASKALNRTGLKILVTGLEHCLTTQGEVAAADRAQLEKLFLTLA